MKIAVNKSSGGQASYAEYDDAIEAMVNYGMSGADIVIALQKACEIAGVEYPSRATIYRKMQEIKARQ